MVRVKRGHTIVQDFIQFVPHTAYARAYAVFFTAGGGETDAAHTIVHKLEEELLPCHILVPEGIEESVSDILCDVMVVHDVESVPAEYLLHPMGSALILPCVLHEIDDTVTGQIEHLCIAVLCGGRAAACDHIQY